MNQSDSSPFPLWHWEVHCDTDRLYFKQVMCYEVHWIISVPHTYKHNITLSHHRDRRIGMIYRSGDDLTVPSGEIQFRLKSSLILVVVHVTSKRSPTVRITISFSDNSMLGSLSAAKQKCQLKFQPSGVSILSLFLSSHHLCQMHITVYSLPKPQQEYKTKLLHCPTGGTPRGRGCYFWGPTQ